MNPPSPFLINPSNQFSHESDFFDLFASGEIEVLSHEKPYSVLIDENGNIHGGIVTSTGYTDDAEWSSVQTEVTFSIAIKPESRRKGYGKKLIQHLVDNNRKSVIKALVVNSHMISLLRGLGFVKEDENNEFDQTFLNLPIQSRSR
jgi:N-acetylglutamate synthase-like GNAT family acetyltransferase